MHHEKSQIADTSFTYTTLKDISTTRYPIVYAKHSLLTVEKIMKYTEEHSNKNIGSGS